MVEGGGMNTCRHCRWWRVIIDDAQPTDFGFCMVDPPAIFCQYDPAGGDAALLYERPQTYADDFCSRFLGGDEESSGRFSWSRESAP